MDPDVVEIPPPMNWSSKSKFKSTPRRKQVVHHEVINIDDDLDCVMLFDENISGYKSKQSTYTRYNMPKTTDGVQSLKNTAVQGAHNSFGIGFSDLDFVSDDAYMDLIQDGLIYDDDSAILQAQFDSIDIPTGIEAPATWFSNPVKNNKEAGSISVSDYPIPQVQSNASGIGPSRSGWKRRIPSSSSSWQKQVAAKHPYGTRLSSFPAFPKSSQNKNKSDTPANSHHLNWEVATAASSVSSEVPLYPPEFSSWKKMYLGSVRDYPPVHLGSVGLPSQWNSYSKRQSKSSVKDKATSNSLLSYQPPLTGNGIYKQSTDAVHLSPAEKLGLKWVLNPPESSTAPSGSTSNTKVNRNQDEIMNNLKLFKQFDTVEDHSDHHYSKSGSSVTQQPKNWAKRIQEEWKILENDLPDTIFVRVYESRMDLMRAVIVGAQGTPYHDGLFFFDIFFPNGYPSVPPKVHYHSGGLRINPNLYNCGKVCLSLLNTWTGSGNEKWIPNVSTMLQVLVSIQALILNENPYFNEPAYAGSAGSAAGKHASQNYNESTFLLSLKTMVYTMRKPPKYFEEFVVGHFCKYAQDILGACKVYMEGGVQVGSVVTKGGVKNVPENVKKCSHHFKGNVASHITMLVEAFVQIGAKDCDKFLSLAKMAGGRIHSSMYHQPPYL